MLACLPCSHFISGGVVLMLSWTVLTNCTSSASWWHDIKTNKVRATVLQRSATLTIINLIVAHKIMMPSICAFSLFQVHPHGAGGNLKLERYCWSHLCKKCSMFFLSSINWPYSYLKPGKQVASWDHQGLASHALLGTHKISFGSTHFSLE